MKKVILTFAFLFSLYFVNAYEGLYFANYLGIDAHLNLDAIKYKQANPYSTIAQTDSDIAAAFNFDIGYTFAKVPFSLALGIELNNWVDPNLRLVWKYNFLDQKLLSPFIYLSLHGGILDIMGFGIHIGAGLDIQINEWYFFSIDMRAGYEAESKVQDVLSNNLKASDFTNELEATISLGMGFKIPTLKLYNSWKEKKSGKTEKPIDNKNE
jgi:hypothetical protein